MAYELIILGSIGTIVSVGAFGGAVYEAFKLGALRQIYENVVSEPIPDDMLLLIESLGGDEDGDQLD